MGLERVSLAFDDVLIDYGDGPVLEGITFKVDQGESVALVGPSGSGKSSILHAAAGITTPLKGSIVVAGTPLDFTSTDALARVRRQRVGLVFQFGELLEEFSILDNVSLPLRLNGSRRRPALVRSQALLQEVDIGGLGGRFPRQVSGGQLQRAAIARAVATEPRVILADEPTGALGEEHSDIVLDVLTRAARQSSSALLVATHDLAIAAKLDRIMTIRGQGLVQAS